MSEIRFMHFRSVNRDGSINGRGGLTIAYAENADGSVHLAKATCSPADNFSKAKGRLVAKSRLEGNSQVHVTGGEALRELTTIVTGRGDTLTRVYGKKPKAAECGPQSCDCSCG